MSLPGLPPPRRHELPIPPGGAAAARRAGRRRRGAVVSAAGAAAVVAALSVQLVGGPTPNDVLQVARGGERSPAAPDLQYGRVTDAAGAPLAGIAVLRSDLTAVLTRSAADGSWSAPCGTVLLFAAYAPSTRGGPVRERSPGAGNVAWRRLREHCGQRATVVLPVGGVLTGRATPGADVRVQRVRGSSREVPAVGPVFVTRVRPDGTWRIEGLDTGRYLLPGGRTVDVREGGTFS
jgi:hypothetical protein